MKKINYSYINVDESQKKCMNTDNPVPVDKTKQYIVCGYFYGW